MFKSTKRQPVKAKRRKRSRSGYVVFVSHSSLDAWIANVIAEKTKALGAECWLDEKDLEGGDIVIDEIIRGIKVNAVDKAAASGEVISTKIKRALTAADEVFVILTQESLDNSNLMFEIGAASSLRKRITPIVVGLEPGELPSIIRNLKYVRYPDVGKYIEGLEGQVKAA